MSLSEMEKETVIQFDESNNMATVYTASWSIVRLLKRAGYSPTKKHAGSWWFQVPVEAVSISGRSKTTEAV